MRVTGVELPEAVTPNQDVPLGGVVERVKPTAAPPLAARLTVCGWVEEPVAALKLSVAGDAAMVVCGLTVNVTGILKGWEPFEGETWMLTLPLYVPAVSEPSVAVTFTAAGVEEREDVAASQLPPLVVVAETANVRGEPSLEEICSALAVGGLPPRTAAKVSED